MFYNGYKGNPHECRVVHKELERLKSITNEQKQHEKFHLAYFCNRSAMKGLGIGIALTIFTALTASFPLTSYAVMLFEKVGTTIDPYNASIMLAVALILGSLSTTYLADVLGRKMLNLISLFGSAFGLLSTALFYYLQLVGFDLSAYAWVPIFCLSLVIFISSAGIVQLSIICSVEYLPAKVRLIECFMLRYFQKYTQMLWFISGSNLWNGHYQLLIELSKFYKWKNIPYSVGIDWFTWVPHGLWCRLHNWLFICFIVSKRNKRTITRWCWSRTKTKTRQWKWRTIRTNLTICRLLFIFGSKNHWIPLLNMEQC